MERTIHTAPPRPYTLAQPNPSKKQVKVILSDCKLNPKQWEFVNCDKKRIIVRAGRRGGKTHGVATRTVWRFLKGRRQLYAAPTQEQVESFWFIVCNTLRPLLDAKVLYKNESLKIIEYPETKQRIKAKTAWNADTLRGDYADDLTLDEWQLMNEDAWELVGAPMLLDNNGDATFIYTPPSLHGGKKFTTKSNDPRHAAKMFKRALDDIRDRGVNSRWAAFHWTSRDNGYISSEAIDELSQDMTHVAYRQEIEAEDIDEAPGALWSRKDIEDNRVSANAQYDMDRIVVGIDPTGSAGGDEAGIVVDGLAGGQYYTMADESCHGKPDVWARAAVNAYKKFNADRIVAEKNYGGEMVELTIHTVDPNVPVTLVTATRGKAVRAEPIAALYEQGKAHHIGWFAKLEDECCLWMPGEKSPNRMDAHVWAMTDLKDGFADQSFAKDAQISMGDYRPDFMQPSFESVSSKVF